MLLIYILKNVFLSLIVRVLLDFLVPLVNFGHLYFSRKLEILNLFQIFHIFGLNLFKVAIIIFKNLNINPLY